MVFRFWKIKKSMFIILNFLIYKMSTKICTLRMCYDGWKEGMLDWSYELKINYIPTLGLQGHKQTVWCHKDCWRCCCPVNTSRNLHRSRTWQDCSLSDTQLHEGSCFEWSYSIIILMWGHYFLIWLSNPPQKTTESIILTILSKGYWFEFSYSACVRTWACTHKKNKARIFCGHCL